MGTSTLAVVEKRQRVGAVRKQGEMSLKKPSKENVPMRRTVPWSAVLNAPESEFKTRIEEFHLDLAPSGGHW